MSAPLLIEASCLFDGSAATPVARLLLEGERIRAVGGGPVQGVEQRSFPNATILPGLIDAHVHLCFDASAAPAETLAERDDHAALAQMARAAERAVRAGVTTVRDLG